MSLYTPDRWVVVRVSGPEGAYNKILAGWYGGWCGSDSWKVSSAITSVTEHTDRTVFLCASGSTYVCHKTAYGMSGYTSSIYGSFKKESEEPGSTFSIELREEYDPN